MFVERPYTCHLCGDEILPEHTHSINHMGGLIFIKYVCFCTPGYECVLNNRFMFSVNGIRRLIGKEDFKLPFNARLRRRVIASNDLVVREFADAIDSYDDFGQFVEDVKLAPLIYIDD